MHKGRRKNPIAESRRPSLPERLHLVNWHEHDKTTAKEKEIENEKVSIWKSLNRVYMSDTALIKENEQLTRLLNDRYILTALSFLRLSYIGQDKNDKAQAVKKLFNDIVNQLGPK